MAFVSLVARERERDRKEEEKRKQEKGLSRIEKTDRKEKKKGA